MFDPMKWFGRAPYQQVEDIEVDQISFTSSCSSGEHDGYETAKDSTSRSHQHINDLISFDDCAPGTSDPQFSPDCPGTSSSSFPGPPPTCPSPKNKLKESRLVRQSIFWFNESEVDASKLVLPISNKGRVCRFDNDVDDNQLETMCRTLQISMGLCERSRWLNHISRDPVMMDLVRELDEDFAKLPEDSEEFRGIEIRPPTSSFSSCSGSFQTIATPLEPRETSGIFDAHIEGVHKTIVPPRRGIQGIDMRRRVNETPSAVCSAIIRQAMEKDPPVDRRMVEWMRGFAEVDTWIQEVAPASRKHDKYSFDVPTLTEDWIMTNNKQPQVRQGLEAQQWKCAACRQSLHSEKDPKFCDYYGLFFCGLCHGGEKSIIPARVIQQWVFVEYPVSDRALRFLRAVRESPVFKIREVSGELLKKNKGLRAVVELRQKLKHMEAFIKICVDASTQICEFGNLSTMFASLDRYLLEHDDLFSLNDLQRVYNKDLLSLLEPLAKRAREHILHCKRCRLQAPVCVRCNDMTDRLFPFEERAVSRCDGCGHLSHYPKCPRRDVPRDTHCPKCARMKSRQRTNSRIFD